ncbi:MAG: hypothetical protein IKC45_07170 [Clostridia bacterium]|nr:hypothetical protein [Clostridia bacterium]
MNKKILAVALAMLFIVTAFTACKSKLEMTEINGSEYPLMTDKSGNTIVNEENKVAVLVTDREGEVLTYADGEDQTYWLQLDGDYVTDDQVQGKLYKLGVPKGWTGNKYGRVVKDKTDENCYIKFTQHAELKKDETLETYLDIIDSNNEAVGEAINDPIQLAELIKKNPSFAAYEGCKYTHAEKTGTISGNLSSEVRVYKIVDKDGNVIHYTENYYFVSNETVYSVDYACEGGEGYDESFDFAKYLGQNFTFKAPKK